MKPRILSSLVALLAILGVAYAFFAPATLVAPENPMGAGGEAGVRTYASQKYGLTFSYPDHYELSEYDAPGSALRERHFIVLINKNDLPLPENGEGPPAITIGLFQNNLDHLETEQWIRGSNDSNFKLSEERLASTSISAFPALSYRWSGLYLGTTIALARPDWIYAFTVTYMDLGADIVQDFVKIRDSVQITL